VYEIHLHFFSCLKESYERARNILQHYSTEHQRLAKALLQYETLNAEEIAAVVQGKSIEKTQ
jgi:ATP-dependent Zn protease